MLIISVISGGSASNELVPIFSRLSNDVSYILPVSDNGGSTAELIRVLSGPAVGDIRSRLTKLIPDEDEEGEALKHFMSYRLSHDPDEAKYEWSCIVEGSHEVWDQIEPGSKEMIRSFLIHVHMELLKRSRNTSRNFKFELASIGNLFLTGARLFCGSLDSAVELFLRITRVPKGVKVIPCLNTNFTYHISALLENGNVITGQSQISHPSIGLDEERLLHSIENLALAFSSADLPTVKTGVLTPMLNMSSSSLNDELLINKFDHQLEDEYATPSYIHPDLKKSHLHFNKDENIPLPSPISRIFYISPYGEEIYPTAHSRVLKQLKDSDLIVYSIGSLMTSTVPVLILQGIGRAILRDPHKKKVFMLNGTNDRETRDLKASGFCEFIVRAFEYSMKLERGIQGYDHEEVPQDWSKYITYLFHLGNHPNIEVDKNVVESHGVKCIEIANHDHDKYDLQDLELKLRELI